MDRSLVTSFVLVLLAASVAAAGCVEDVGEIGEDAFDGSPDEAAGENYSHLLEEPPDFAFDAEVVDVVDGDTFDVRLANGSEDTVRVVGVDAPEPRGDNRPEEYGLPATAETEDCLQGWGYNATDYAEDRLSDRNVTLAFDPVDRQRGGYGRLLTYVYVDGELYGLDLVEQGLARTYTQSLFVLKDEFLEAEGRAREEGVGLWRCG